MPILQRCETRLAELELHDASILVVRFKRATPLDLEGVIEVIERRIDMCAGRKTACITVLPEDLDAEIDVMVNDHAQKVKAETLAEVCVSSNMHHRRLAELYYSNFPQPFPTSVFVSEEEAINWLHAYMEPVLE